MRGFAAWGVAFVLGLAVGGSPDEPTGFVKFLPGDIKWVRDRVEPAVESVILLGDPSQPGPFVLRVRAQGEVKVMPHTHPVDRTYTVLAGEWKLGFGKAYDPAKLMTFPAGSIYRLPADVAHFQATGPGETIVQIHAVGPSTTDFLDADGRPKKTDKPPSPKPDSGLEESGRDTP
jgi:hypothetical protein